MSDPGQRKEARFPAGMGAILDGVILQLMCCSGPFHKFGDMSVLSATPPIPDGQCHRSGSLKMQAAMT